MERKYKVSVKPDEKSQTGWRSNEVGEVPRANSSLRTTSIEAAEDIYVLARHYFGRGNVAKVDITVRLR